MTLLSQLTAVLAILSTGDRLRHRCLCALVQRSALVCVDDTALTAVMGNVHRYADRRMPIPGILGVIAAAAPVFAAVAGHSSASAAAAAAFLLQVLWVLHYLRISASINRRSTAAADAHETPADARALQRARDRIIVPRADLQCLTVLALGVSLIL